MTPSAIIILTALIAKNVFCQNDLKQEFQPSVKASCAGSSMIIRVDTNLPFQGIIHSVGFKDEGGCYQYGRGGLKTFLTIDLTLLDNCGVRFNSENGDRSVMVAVRADPLVDLLQDRLFSLSCSQAGFQNSRADITLVNMKLTDGSRELRAGLQDVSYNLRAEVVDHNPSLGLFIKNCLAFDLTGSLARLVDDRGCRNEKLISAWRYDQTSGVADTTLYSLLNFPQSNRTFYQCDVQLCEGQCQLPDCSGAQAEAGASRQVFLDTATSSVTVFVADPSAGTAGADDCSLGDGNPSWLRGLTIAFGVLFGIMLLINVFLCSAMTCSCTRTEVIEKEPSLYENDDDIYGEYDNKTYSDPGSEEFTSQFGAVASEAGTYRSDTRHGAPAKYLQ